MADHETARPPPDLIYQDTGAAAPVVYFDIIGPTAPCMAPSVRFLSSGRLRCGAHAAANLRHALDAALKILEHPQSNPVAASKLN